VQPRPIVAGQSGQRHLVLQARRSGKDIVTLQYQQWWDNGQKQAPKVMIVQVED
jgi:predicted secreted protein